MGQDFDRIGIALTEGGTEYVVLESQLMIDFGGGQGPRGGVVTIEDGWMAARGAGEARLSGGFHEQGGDMPPNLKLDDPNGQSLLEIAAYEPASGIPAAPKVYLEGESATLRMRSAAGEEHVLLDGRLGDLWLGGKTAGGNVVLFHSGEASNRTSGNATIHLNGQAVVLTMRDPDRNLRVELDGWLARLRMRDAENNVHTTLDGASGNLWLGGKKADGDVVLFPSNEPDNHNTDKANIHLNGQLGEVRLRAHDDKGNVFERIHLDSQNGNIWLGGNGAAGDLMIFSKDPRDPLNEDSSLANIVLKGSTGDIVLRNADCAEDFDVVASEQIEPGTLVVLDEDGTLQTSRQEYDKKVAGVISGAGDYKPGIVLDRNPAKANRMPVALLGKAFCKVDARYSPIGVGDLLTSSPTPGHAMKAVDPVRAFGAVIGKAMSPLSAGQGMIPVLISLQ